MPTTPRRAGFLDSDDADSYGGRGLTHYDLGDPMRTIADFDKAIDLDPREAFHYASWAL